MAAEAPITAKKDEYSGADILSNTPIIKNTAQKRGLVNRYMTQLYPARRSKAKRRLACSELD